MTLPPLRFEPIFKTNLWGGRRLRPWLHGPASAEPTGEAWLLSDVDGSPSRVRGGPHDGKTLRELMAEFGPTLLGDVPPIDGRFPLLLKFLDAKQELSVQVHPTDEQAREKHPAAAGKTEAWVVLDADPRSSRLYSGFKEGVSAESFRAALTSGTAAEALHSFTPKPGDCVFLPAGTVHAIGADLLLFEVQQTSDITYRLHDWDRLDASGRPRDLHLDDGLACSDFAKGPCGAVVPRREAFGELLVNCEYFSLQRHAGTGTLDLPRGLNACRIVVVVSGSGTLNGEAISTGDAVLIPACEDFACIRSGELLTCLLIEPRSVGTRTTQRP